jgi:hypothetical protein
MTSEDIKVLVDKVYTQFCSGSARHSEVASKLVTHANMLLRICNFATIVEANWAMKAGDPGRHIYMWQRWSVMGQAIPNLPHYSKQLPRLILLLEEGLPCSLAKVVQSTMLISPTGREDHFMPTDQFVEVQNYWLKHFFNSSGTGTEIDRLKDVFSINIPIVSMECPFYFKDLIDIIH